MAVSSLGHLLTKATAFSAGSHGPSPSRTSQWASVDIGLYPFRRPRLGPGATGRVRTGQRAGPVARGRPEEGCGEPCLGALARRGFPTFRSTRGALRDHGALKASLSWYVSDEAEAERGDKAWSELLSLKRCTSAAHDAGTCHMVQVRKSHTGAPVSK